MSAKSSANLVKIGEASRILGVSIDTLRRWEKAGKIQAIRTPGGTRLYSLESLQKVNPSAAYEPSINPLSTEELLKKTENQIKSDRSEYLWISEPVISDTDFPISSDLSGKKSFLKKLLLSSAVISFISVIIVSWMVSSYISSPEASKQLFGNNPVFAPFNKAARIIAAVIDPPPLNKFEAQNLDSSVLATVASSQFLEINSDTRINGSLFVADAINELQIQATPSASTFALSSGDTTLTVTKSSRLDQDVSTAASPAFKTLNLSATSNQLVLQSGGPAGTLTWTPTAARTITLPDVTTTLVGTDNSQTLTNKSLSGSSNTFTNIPNSALSNKKVTVSAGTNLSGGGDVELGSSITLALKDSPAISGVLKLADGTAAAPSLTFSNDSDSGLYRLSANTIGLITGGVATQGITIDATGNLGVGTIAPTATLDVTGTANVTGNTTLGGTLGVTAATTLSSTLAVTGDTTLTGDLAVNGGDITTSATTFNLINTTATTLNIGGAATTLSLGASTGTATINNATTALTGVLNVNGTGTSYISGNLGVGTSSPSQQFQVNQSGTTGINAFVVTSAGNVGIGTTSPTQKLSIAGGNIYQTSVTTPTVIGTATSASADLGSVYVQGRYAYTITGGRNLQITDVSNPSSPQVVSTTNLRFFIGGGGSSMVVSGKYAYISGAPAYLEAGINQYALGVVDISNPTSPFVVGSVSGITNFYQSSLAYGGGNYVYLMSNNTLRVINISNPQNPTVVGSLTSSTYFYNDNNHTDGIYAMGNYVYVASPSVNRLTVVDVSNPAAPTVAGSLQDNTYLNFPGPMAVSGKYAYVITSEAGAGFTTPYLTVVDISNPATPTRATSVVADTTGCANPSVCSPTKIVIAGRYAYVSSTYGSSLTIYDISNPLSPYQTAQAYIAGSDGRPNELGLFVAGKYAYTNSGRSLVVVDIPGIDAPTANIGDLFASHLSVSGSVDLGNNLFVGNGINVGQGGIFSAGSVGIGVTSSQPALMVNQMGSGAAASFFGNVGVGTSSPGAKLAVAGGTILGYTGTQSLASGTDLAVLGNVGIGTTSPNYKLEVVGTSNVTGAATFGNTGSFASTLTASNGLTLTTGALNLTSTSGAVDLTLSSSQTAFNIQSGLFDIDTASSRVGIGTATPQNKLDVSGAVAIGSYAGTNTAPSNGLIVSGNVGIGTSSPQSALHVAGVTTVGDKILPSTGSIDIGSSAIRFGTGYFDTINATNLAGVITGGSTTSSDWTINSDNATADTEDASLTFERGSITPNAVFGWDSTNKEFDLNGGLHITDTITPTGSQTLLNLSYAGTGAAFRINDDGTSTDSTPFLIDANGNVGIGTSTPGSSLQINGGAVIGYGGAPFAAPSQGLVVSGNTGIGTTAPSQLFQVNPSGSTAFVVTSGGNVGIGFTTPGAPLSAYSQSITSGKLVDINTLSSNTLTTGTLLNVASTATSLTGAAGTGSLLHLSWAPPSSTTATGDLFALSIGANGTTTGNLFNILDSGSSIFSISESAVTTSLPVNFTSPGDVSIAYDINFTNPTASYIKSAAPLYIVAGETFNSSDLNLQTYNSGNIVFTAGSSGNMILTSGGNLGLGLNVTTPTSMLSVAGNVGIGVSYGASSINTPINGLAVQGNVGVGTTTANYNLSVIGTGNFTGNVGVGSSLTVTGLTIANGGISTTAINASSLVTSGNITSAGVFLAADGSASAPSYSFTNDTDSGLYRFGSNGLALKTGGIATNLLSLNSDGNVGIGTTSPLQALHVVGQCVAEGTRIRRKRKGSRSKGEDEWEEVPVEDIKADDEVLSLNEKTGEFEWNKVEKTMDMGIQEVFRLETEEGKWIETTANHPYLIRAQKATKKSAFADFGDPTKVGSNLDYHLISNIPQTNLNVKSTNQTSVEVAGFAPAEPWVIIQVPYSSTPTPLSLSQNSNLFTTKWVKVSQLKTGMEIATINGFEKIISIKKIGRTQTYDLQIENTHNFVGNNIVAHNTYINSGLNIGAAFTGGAAVPSNGLAVSGNVGIGTTTTTHNLEVIGTGAFSSTLSLANGSATTPALNFSNLTNSGLWTNGDGLLLTTGGSNTSGITVTGAGNIGIGVTNPVGALQVNGAAAIGYGSIPTSSLPSSGLAISGNLGIGTTTTSNKLTVAGNANINGHAAIGLSSSALTDYAANVSETITSLTGGTVITGTSGTFAGALRVASTFSPASDPTLSAYTSLLTTSDTGSGAVTIGGNSTTLEGIMSQARNMGTGDVTNIMAITGSAQKNSTGNVTNAYGVVGRVANWNATGSISNAYGIQAYNWANNGTMTNYYGIYSSDSTGTSGNSGTITNAYGLYIAAQTNSQATNKVGLLIGEATSTGSGKDTNLLIGTTTVPAGSFSIYNASANSNYFAGNIGIGATANSALTVIGNVGIGVSATGSQLQVNGGAIFWPSTTALTAPSNGLAVSGNVGVGTSSPLQPLHIQGNGSNAAIFMNGNVGIGFTSPQATLQIQGNVGIGASLQSANLLQVQSSDGSLPVWNTNSNTLPATRANSSSVSMNGYIYIISGELSNTVYYAKVNADGSTSAWNTNPYSTPVTNQFHTSVAANGYVYMIGGHNGSTGQTSVYYARANNDGTIGPWGTTSSLPLNKYRHTSVVANGFVYAIGGQSSGGNVNTVYYAKLNADGTLGTWASTTSQIDANGYSTQAAVAANGYVYTIGGTDAGSTVQSRVDYAKINLDGTLGAWAATNSLPAARFAPSAVVANGYMYVTGGSLLTGNTTTDTVFTARINNNGTVGSFSTNANSLPAARSHSEMVVVNGYIYVIGGETLGAGGAKQATVFYTSTPRIAFSGSLDLLSLNNANPADATGDYSRGSIGGSIYAGNIFSAGNLDVNGNANFWNGAGFFGPVSIGVGSTSPSSPIFNISNGNGPQVLSVFSGGNIGIGTTSSGANFTVAGNGLFGWGSARSIAAPANGLAVSGNVGVGTTSPLQALHVVGQCVTGDTKLRRRRKKRKGESGKGKDEEWDEVPIKDIQPGDEILSMDPGGTFTWSKVNNLMDMGVQDTYKLITNRGKQIRTTGNHPYFVLEKRPTKVLEKLYTTFEIDQSNRLEDMGIDSVVALASKETGQAITIKISKKAKLGIYKKYYQNKRKLFGPEMISIMVMYAIWTLGLKAGRLVIDKEYPKYEEYISNFITRSFPEIVVSFRSIGHQVMAHQAAWSRATKKRTPQRSVLLKTLANLDFEESLATELLHSGLVTGDSQSTRSSLLAAYQSPLSLSTSMSMSEARWIPAQAIRKGMLVATVDGWEVITAIYKTGVREQVWDIEVENTHNFVGNDIVAHNTYISGNVGLGVTTPGSTLSINGNSTIGYSGVNIAGPSNGLAVSGNVGIGTTTANNNLSVVGGVNISNNYQNIVAPTSGLFVEGNVGIGATTSSNKLDVWGNARIAGNLTTDGTFTTGAISAPSLTLSGNNAALSFTGSTPSLTSGGNSFSLFAGGNVGIGTSATLGSSLNVNGNQVIGASFIGGAAPANGLAVSGNVGIGTTSPLQALHVVGQCVTPETKLKRRRRRKGKKGEWEDYFEDVEIKDIKSGDEILTLDQDTGKFVVSKVRALKDMGKQEVYELVTESGKSIQTTKNHPYFVDLTEQDFDLNMIQKDTFEYSEKLAKAFYVNNLAGRKVKSKALGDTVIFTHTGWNHFVEKSRSLNELMTRFFALPRATMVLKHAQKIQNYRKVEKNGMVIEYWEFQQIIDYVLAKVIVCSIDGGPKFFLTTVWLGTKQEEGFKANKKELSLSPRKFNSHLGRRRELVIPQLFNKLTLPENRENVKWVKVQDLAIGQKIATTSGWERIVSIKSKGKKQTFDIEVENTHNFVGNNIVAHNTYISGNVGLGVTTPGSTLSINGNSTIGYSGVNIAGPSNGLAVSGNVGIGTTTANSNLSVNGSAHIGGLYQGISAPSNGLFVDGNVGIGATTSSNKLDVWGNARITGTLTVDGAQTFGGDLTLSGNLLPSADDTYDLGSNTARWRDLYLGPGTLHIGTSTSDEYTLSYDTTSNYLGFNVNGSGGSEIAFDSNGNIGIGTTSPTAKLHVTNGGININNNEDGTVPQLNLTYSGSTAVSEAINFYSGSSLKHTVGHYTGNNDFFIDSYNAAGTKLTPLTANADTRLFMIDPNAQGWNTGIGTNNPGAKLSVTGNVGIGISFGTGVMPVNGLGIQGNVGIGTSTTTNALQVVGSTVLGFAPSAAGPSSGLAVSGNVGVGTTSPLQALHVVGQCVTGDTLLKRRRKRKKKVFTNSDGNGDPDSLENLKFEISNLKSILNDLMSKNSNNKNLDLIKNLKLKIKNYEALLDAEYYWEDVRIDEIEAGDEILTLDEATGEFVPSQVKGLMDMGTKDIIKITTVSGKSIRTTSEHPYMVKAEKKNQIDFILNHSFEEAKKLAHDFYFNYLDKISIKVPALKGEKVHFTREGWEHILAEKRSTHELLTRLFTLTRVQAVLENTTRIIDHDERVLIDKNFDHMEYWVFEEIVERVLVKVVIASYEGGPKFFLSAIWKGTKAEEGIKKELSLACNPRRRRMVTSQLFNRLIIPQDDLMSSQNGKWIKVKDLTVGAEIATMDGWEQISRIEHLSREQVWDIEVENTHNFVGNNIVAHNTYITGNVGLGVTTPGSTLSINGNSTIGYSGVNIAGPSNGLAVSGNVGIGTTTANSNLSVVGNAHIGGLYQGISAPTDGLFVDGNVGIGATTSSNKLDVWGNARVTGTLSVDSTGTLGAGLIGYSGVTAPTSGLAVSGNVGVGTTSPLQALHVVGQCVTEGTRIRRRRKNSKGEWEEEEIPVEDIKADDEVLSLNEKTGEFEWNKVEKTMDMGIQQVFGIKTSGGKYIKTTSNHPYLVQVKPLKVVSGTFEIDISGRVEELNKDTFIALANKENSFVLRLTAKEKRILKVLHQADHKSKFGFQVYAHLIVQLILLSKYQVKKLIIDHDYEGNEAEIKGIVVSAFPQLQISFASVGKSSPADLAAGRARERIEKAITLNAKEYLNHKKGTQFALKGATEDSDRAECLQRSPTPRVPFADYHKLCNLSMGEVKWIKVGQLNKGDKIATLDGWEHVIEIAELDREKTYDLQIANTHNFIGNNIVAHNTYISGNVGLGVTTPGSTLSINGNSTIGYSGVNIAGPSNGLAVSGNVGIGTTTADYNLSVIGTGNFTGNVGIGSSLTVTGLSVLNGGISTTAINASSLVTSGNITSAGVFLASNGTAAAPSYSFTNDTDSGLWRIGANQIALTTGGGAMNGLAINSSGNVGIGNTSASQLFQIGPNNNNGSSAMVFTSGGNLGIGTTGPSFPLQVNGNIGINNRGSIYNANSGTSAGGVRVEEATTNMIYNPSMESASYFYPNNYADGWYATYTGSGSCGQSISRVNTNSVFGNNSGKLSITSLTCSQAGATYSHVTSTNLPVSPGITYTYSVYVKALQNTTFSFVTYDGNGGQITYHAGGGASLTPANGWKRLSFSWTPVAGTINASVAIFASVPAATGDVFLWDGAQVEQKSSYATSYADGSLGQGYAWSGTAHASTSTRTAALFTSDNAITGIGGINAAGNLFVSNNAGIGYNSMPGAALAVNGNVGIGTSYAWAPLYVNGAAMIGYSSGAASSIANGLAVSGNIGIGTSNTVNKLDVNGGVAIGSFAGIGTVPSNGLAVSGNVGIGTTTANNKLTVVGAGTFGTNYGGYTAPTNGLLIEGNVGIGTTAPSSFLHVKGAITGAGSNPFMTLENSNTASTDQVRLSLLKGSDTGSGIVKGFVLYSGNTASGLADYETRAINFYTGTGAGAASERMRIDNTGNVGIGSSNPTAKLQVVGNTTIGYAEGTAGPSNGLAVSGNVGIGTTTTSHNLEVIGTGAFSSTLSLADGTAATPGLNFGADTDSGLWRIGANQIALTTGGGSHSGLAINSSGNVGIGNTSPSQLFQVNANASNPFVVTSGGNVGIGFTTPGAPLSVYSQSVTSGKLVDINTLSSNTLTTGTLLNVASTATSLTGAAGTGSLLHLSWAPPSSTTATGDLFALSIGANGTTTGNLFNILDAGSSIFSISETAVTTSLPVNFTSPGDVSIAYDINFTNPTASYIKSQAPLYVVAGETFNSSNLTLQTYNSGGILLDAGLNGNVGIGTSGYTNFLFTASGNLGIGTSAANPTAMLQLTGNATIGYAGGTAGPSSGLAVSGNVGIGATTANSNLFVNGGAAIGSNFNVTAPTNGLVVQGNTGIGTSAPAHPLQVRGTGAGVGLFERSVSSTNTANRTLDIKATTSGDMADNFGAGLAFAIQDNAGVENYISFINGVRDGADNTGALGFVTSTSGTATERMRLTNGGNLGIGTTSPRAQLEVWGNGTNTAAFLNGNVGIGTSAPASDLHIHGTAPAIRFTSTNNLSGARYDTIGTATQAHRFQYNGTTLLTIDVNGNTIIGGGSAQLATNATNGFFYLDSTNAAPSGTPTSYAGNVASVYDTTNNKLCFYNGAWKCSQAGQFADYAEWMPARGAEIGDIVTITDEKNPVADDTAPFMLGKTTSSYSSKIVGIVSKYAEEGNSAAGYKLSDDYHAVALAGRVPVKVSTENGPIKAGDYLTSSSTPGVAMKATKPGQVVGKALEDFDGNTVETDRNTVETQEISTNFASGNEHISKILVFVNVSFADPGNFLASISLDSDGNLIMPKAKIGSLTIDPSIATASSQLTINNGQLAINSDPNYTSTTPQTVADNSSLDVSAKIASLEERIMNYESRIKNLEDKLASSSATISHDSLFITHDSSTATSSATTSAFLAEATSSATESAFLADTLIHRSTDTLNLTPPDILLATGSAVVADLKVHSDATISGMLIAYKLNVSDGFKSFGATSLGNTSVAGNLSVDGTLSIENGSEINVIGTLYLQKSILAQKLDIFNGSVTIDKTGKLTAQTISAREFQAVAGTSTGGGIIPAGYTNVTIPSGIVKPNSRILITPTTQITQTLAVTNKAYRTNQSDPTNPGFTVSIPYATTKDITFDWWIINEVEPPALQ